MTIRSIQTALSVDVNDVIDTINVPQPGAGGTWRCIRISNFSSYPCAIIGVGGDPASNPYNLAPLQEDVYDFRGTAAGTVQIRFDAPGSVGIEAMFVNVEFADDPQQIAFPGIYPTALNAPALITVNTPNPEEYLGTFGATDDSEVIGIGSGVAMFKIVLFGAPGAAPPLNVNGNESGIIYPVYGPINLDKGGGYATFLIPISPSIDKFFTIGWTGDPGATWIVFGVPGGVVPNYPLADGGSGGDPEWSVHVNYSGSSGAFGQAVTPAFAPYLVPFDDVDLDTSPAGAYTLSSLSKSYQYTTIKVRDAGIYLLTITENFNDSILPMSGFLGYMLNGVDAPQFGGIFGSVTTPSHLSGGTCTDVIELSAGDELTPRVWAASGGNIFFAPGKFVTCFALRFLGPK